MAEIFYSIRDFALFKRTAVLAVLSFVLSVSVVVSPAFSFVIQPSPAEWMSAVTSTAADSGSFAFGAFIFAITP